ncbi:MAG: N-acetyl-gamma-glutamyl-phosphate reductase [Campylobacter sp.]|nr:N-acetyl-gamma-glutamyl-phosphate reductase [Campylobacter sp.]
MILNHPALELAYLGARSAGNLNKSFEFLDGIYDAPIFEASAKAVAKECELVFLALPHTQSFEFVSELLGFGVKVVDLSADYRLSLELYEKNYGTHKDPKNLKNAVYGLTEVNKELIKNANLVANPGCYPTCSTLAILPFLEFMDEKFGVIIDAKSGVSGAGKSLKESSHFMNVNENFKAYSALTHRHKDEIKEQISKFASKNIPTTFVPHLLPINSGMMASVYGVLKKECEPLEILRDFYRGEKFIRIRDKEVSIKNVVGTHFCDIYAKIDGDKIWINSTIDNIYKGASSQALANANLMLKLDESLALPVLGYGI